MRRWPVTSQHVTLPVIAIYKLSVGSGIYPVQNRLPGRFIALVKATAGANA